MHRVAGYLVQSGVRKGDRVALTGKNSPEWTIAYLAALMRIAEAQAFFADEEKYDTLTSDFCGARTRISLSPSRPNYILDIQPSSPVDHSAERPVEEDTAAILFTSGTTGSAKGVMLGHRNLLTDTYLSQASLNVCSDDVFYALLTMRRSYTLTAMFLEAVSVGADIVFGQKMVSKQIFEDLKRGQVTMFVGVPMPFNKLLVGIREGIREKGLLVYSAIRTLTAVSVLIKKLFRVNPGKKIFRFILERVSLEDIRICISGGGPCRPALSASSTSWVSTSSRAAA